jgi:hypothetical protein
MPTQFTGGHGVLLMQPIVFLQRDAKGLQKGMQKGMQKVGCEHHGIGCQ